ITPTLLLLALELGLGGLEGRRVDDRWHRNGNPLFGWHFPPAGFFVWVAFARQALHFAIIQRADIGRVAQNVGNSRGMPYPRGEGALTVLGGGWNTFPGQECRNSFEGPPALHIELKDALH